MILWAEWAHVPQIRDVQRSGSVRHSSSALGLSSTSLISNWLRRSLVAYLKGILQRTRNPAHFCFQSHVRGSSRRSFWTAPESNPSLVQGAHKPVNIIDVKEGNRLSHAKAEEVHSGVLVNAQKPG